VQPDQRQRIAWERKNLPSAQLNPSIADKPHGCWVLRSEFTVNVGIALTVNFSRELDATFLPSSLPSD
jgi:hypothetical protein